jgi:hypothetical protein
MSEIERVLNDNTTPNSTQAKPPQIPFIQIPRSLLEDPKFLSAPLTHRMILIHLIESMCFGECTQDDKGVLVILKPGQLLMTRRGFAEYIKAKDYEVRQTIDRFTRCGFLAQEIAHTKTIITIKHSDTYALFQKQVNPKFSPGLAQDWPKISPQKDKIDKEDKEEKKKKKIIKEKILIREWVELTIEERDKFFHINGDTLANTMLDILDAYNTREQKHYPSDYGALKQRGWVHKEALKQLAPTKTYHSGVDRRTQNVDGSPVTSPHDGRF